MGDLEKVWPGMTWEARRAMSKRAEFRLRCRAGWFHGVTILTPNGIGALVLRRLGSLLRLLSLAASPPFSFFCVQGLSRPGPFQKGGLFCLYWPRRVLGLVAPATGFTPQDECAPDGATEVLQR